MKGEAKEVAGLSLSPEKDSFFDRAGRTGAIKEVFADIRDYELLNSYINYIVLVNGSAERRQVA